MCYGVKMALVDNTACSNQFSNTLFQCNLVQSANSFELKVNECMSRATVAVYLECRRESLFTHDGELKERNISRFSPDERETESRANEMMWGLTCASVVDSVFIQ